MIRTIYVMIFITIVYSILTNAFFTSSNLQSKRIKSKKLIPLHDVSGIDGINNLDTKSQVFLLSTLSLAGAIETGYLTWSKLFSSDISSLCIQGQSCSDVLQSPYSMIPFFNIPVSMIGMISYGTIFFLSQSIHHMNENISNFSKSSLVLLSTMMATFSGYLMTILQFVIKENCSFCYISAFLSFSILLIMLRSNIIRKNTNTFILVGSSATITSLFSIVLFYVTTTIATSTVVITMNPNTASASTAPIAQLSSQDIDKYLKNVAPTIQTISSDKALGIGRRLKALDAKMYGAYWCSHCFNQKQNLGKEAFEMIKYVECDKEGFNSQYPLCKEKKVPGYPTWEIKGKLYPGEKELDELDRLVADIETNKVQ